MLSGDVTLHFPTRGVQALELTIEAFSMPNLINAQWGSVRGTALDPSVVMLRMVGYDAARGRGIYRLALPQRETVLDPSTQGRLQFRVRYLF